jgi:hypothetical protein
VIGISILAIVGLGVYLAGLGSIRDDRVVTLEATNCQESNTLVLLAQSVPTAQLIPCLTEGAEGWVITQSDFTSDGSTVVLATGDMAGATWTLTLDDTCTPDAGATERSYPDQQGRYEVVGLESGDGDTEVDTEWYRFDGGCATSSVSIPSRFDANRIFDEMDEGFVFANRSAINQLVVDESDGRLTLDPPAGPR